MQTTLGFAPTNEISNIHYSINFENLTVIQAVDIEPHCQE